MSVLLDTGVIFAYLNREEVRHGEARGLMVRIARKEFGAPFVTDHVGHSRSGRQNFAASFGTTIVSV